MQALKLKDIAQQITLLLKGIINYYKKNTEM